MPQPRSPWRYRKYQLIATAVNISRDLVFVASLGYINLSYDHRVQTWCFRRLADTRRNK